MHSVGRTRFYIFRAIDNRPYLRAVDNRPYLRAIDNRPYLRAIDNRPYSSGRLIIAPTRRTHV